MKICYSGGKLRNNIDSLYKSNFSPIVSLYLRNLFEWFSCYCEFFGVSGFQTRVIRILSLNPLLNCAYHIIIRAKLVHSTWMSSTERFPSINIFLNPNSACRFYGTKFIYWQKIDLINIKFGLKIFIYSQIRKKRTIFSRHCYRIII